MNETETIVMIGVIVALVIMIGLVVFALFFWRKDASLWKYVLTLAPGAGTAMAGLYARTPTPAESAIMYVGLAFLVPIAGLVVAELIGFAISFWDYQTTLERIEAIHTGLLAGKKLGQVAAELRISKRTASNLAQLMTAVRSL